MPAGPLAPALAAIPDAAGDVITRASSALRASSGRSFRPRRLIHAECRDRVAGTRRPQIGPWQRSERSEVACRQPAFWGSRRLRASVVSSGLIPCVRALVSRGRNGLGWTCSTSALPRLRSPARVPRLPANSRKQVGYARTAAVLRFARNATVRGERVAEPASALVAARRRSRRLTIKSRACSGNRGGSMIAYAPRCGSGERAVRSVSTCPHGCACSARRSPASRTSWSRSARAGRPR